MDNIEKISAVYDGYTLDTEADFHSDPWRTAVDDRNRRHLAEYVGAYRQHRADGPCNADQVCAGPPVARSISHRAMTRPRLYLLTLLTTAVRMLTEREDEIAALSLRHEVETTELGALLEQAREELAAADLLLAEVRPDVTVVDDPRG